MCSRCFTTSRLLTKRPAILEKVTLRDRGIDAPAGMYAPTYYFAWYLVRAFEHVGNAERYFDLLKTWRDLLALNYTTWPESRDQPRSDTHAWSAHPTADLLGIVAGIRPAAPGYSRAAYRAAARAPDVARCHCGDAAGPGEGELSHRRQSTDRRDRSTRRAARNFRLARQVAPAEGDTNEVRTAALKEFPCLPAASF